MLAITGTLPGDPGVSTPTEPPRPTLGPGQVLVDVSVVGITSMDV